MSPEVAATFTLLGVVAGAAISGGIALRVNDRAQKAQDRRLEVQFAEAAAKEKRDLALEVRRHRLQPALEMLSELERMVGAEVESSAIDALRGKVEQQTGEMAEERWEEIKSTMRQLDAPTPAALAGEHFPKIMGVPVDALSAELRLVLAIAISETPIRQRSVKQRNALLSMIRRVRDAVDAEIIRGEWP